MAILVAILIAVRSIDLACIIATRCRMNAAFYLEAIFWDMLVKAVLSSRQTLGPAPLA
jgi:hypothetical protein